VTEDSIGERFPWDTWSDREKAAWISSLWEGEGSVVAKIDAKKPKSNGVTASITMTDREPLDRVAEFVGGKVLGPYDSPSRRDPNWKPIYAWGVHNWNAVEHFYSIIGPWLASKRRIDQWAGVLAKAIPAERRGRGKYQKVATECRNGHEWTEENTLRTADGRRRCRACRDIRNAQRHLEKNAGEPVRALGAHTAWHANRGYVHPNCIHCGTAPWDPAPPRSWGQKKNPKLVTSVGMHNRWHVNRDIVHPNCIFCGTGEGEPSKLVWTAEQRLAQSARVHEIRGTEPDLETLVTSVALHNRKHRGRGWVHPRCIHCETADWSLGDSDLESRGRFKLTDKPITHQSSHTRWHTQRGIVHPFCVFCGTAPGWEPDSQANPAVAEANRRREWTPEARMKQAENFRVMEG